MDLDFQTLSDRAVYHRFQNVDEILCGICIEYEMLFQQTRERYECLDAKLGSMTLHERQCERVLDKVDECNTAYETCDKRITQLVARKDELLPQWTALKAEAQRRGIWHHVPWEIRQRPH